MSSLPSLRNRSLRRSRFDGADWHGWDDQGGVCPGTPSASSRRADQLDLVVRAPDNSLFMRTFVSGHGLPWLASPSYAASPSDPLIVSSEGQKVDLFHEDLNGNLRVSWRHWHWLNEWLDPGVPVGTYLAGVSKAPGTYG